MYGMYRQYQQGGMGGGMGSGFGGGSSYGGANAFGRTFGSMPSRGNTGAFNFNFSGPLDDKVRHHLTNVYSNLFLGIGAACLGIFTYMKYEFNMMVATLAFFGLTMALFFTRHIPGDEAQITKRRYLLIGAAYFNGLVIAPIVEVNFISAFLCTTLIFGCLTGAAFFAKRREYFFLGGLLSSAMSVLCFLSFINFFVGSYHMFTAQLYIGLLVFIGYVLFNTQVIIEKAIAIQYPDPIMDSFTLFTDFIGILVRISIILQQNQRSTQRKRERRE